MLPPENPSRLPGPLSSRQDPLLRAETPGCCPPSPGSGESGAQAALAFEAAQRSLALSASRRARAPARSELRRDGRCGGSRPCARGPRAPDRSLGRESAKNRQSWRQHRKDTKKKRRGAAGPAGTVAEGSACSAGGGICVRSAVWTRGPGRLRDVHPTGRTQRTGRTQGQHDHAACVVTRGTAGSLHALPPRS